MPTHSNFVLLKLVDSFNTGLAANQTATPSLSVATDPGSGKC